MARLEIKIVLQDGRLQITESTTETGPIVAATLLSTSIVDVRTGEETARLAAKLVGTRLADVIAEQAGIEVGHGG